MNKKYEEQQKKNYHFSYKRKRKKILMYTFINSYSDFLKNMVNFKINKNKFKNIDEKYKELNSYKEILNSFNSIKENSHFLNLIINSGLPFIFLYIPNTITESYQKAYENVKIQKKFKEQDQKLEEQEQ